MISLSGLVFHTLWTRLLHIQKSKSILFWPSYCTKSKLDKLLVGPSRTKKIRYRHVVMTFFENLLDDYCSASRLGIPIFGSDFWEPHWRRNSDSVYDSEDSGRIFFFEIPISGEPENWNSNLRFLEFWLLHRNSVHLFVANLYWLQCMYNDLILMVHKLVAPLQH